MTVANRTKLARHQVITVSKSVTPLLSPTSLAEVCFTQQKFSRLLQEFMCSYSSTVSSPLVLTDESYSILEQSLQK